MDHNLVVMEVKPAAATRKKLAADLRKLSKFVNEARYLRGILLTYSNGAEQPPLAVVEASGRSSGNVWVMWQPGPGRS